MKNFNFSSLSDPRASHVAIKIRARIITKIVLVLRKLKMHVVDSIFRLQNSAYHTSPCAQMLASSLSFLISI